MQFASFELQLPAVHVAVGAPLYPSVHVYVVVLPSIMFGPGQSAFATVGKLLTAQSCAPVWDSEKCSAGLVN